MELVFSAIRAFLVGGVICLIGQFLLNKTSLVPARILVIYVVLGAFLEAVGIYKYLIRFGGAGAMVPLTGFGSLLCKGARDAVREEGFLGIFKGGLSCCSIGISVAIFSGLIIAFLFRSRGR